MKLQNQILEHGSSEALDEVRRYAEWYVVRGPNFVVRSPEPKAPRDANQTARIVRQVLHRWGVNNHIKPAVRDKWHLERTVTRDIAVTRNFDLFYPAETLWCDWTKWRYVYALQQLRIYDYLHISIPREYGSDARAGTQNQAFKNARDYLLGVHHKRFASEWDSENETLHIQRIHFDDSAYRAPGTSFVQPQNI